MARGSCIERINDADCTFVRFRSVTIVNVGLTFDGRFRVDTGRFLSPVNRYATSILIACKYKHLKSAEDAPERNWYNSD